MAIYYNNTPVLLHRLTDDPSTVVVRYFDNGKNKSRSVFVHELRADGGEAEIKRAIDFLPESNGSVKHVRYNGCANWETWLVKTELTNNEGLYKLCSIIVESKLENELVIKRLQAITLMQAGFVSGFGLQVVQMFLDQVNWPEIVQTFE